MNFVLSESELYLKVVPMDWIIFFVILGHLKMFDIRHALYLIRSNVHAAKQSSILANLMFSNRNNCRIGTNLDEKSRLQRRDLPRTFGKH